MKDRRLAAVMFTDMVGYTALMQTDEVDTRARRRRWIEAMERRHAEHSGRVSKWMGDGSVSIFASAVEAVQAATEIQQDLRTGEPVDVRIGIHVGEVVEEAGDVLGDAVNLASRVESFAAPGSVLVSDLVVDATRNRPDLDFRELGRFRFKNVGRPFTLHAVAAPGLVMPDPDELEGKGEVLRAFPATLPRRPASFVGRDGDVARLASVLAEHRFVTITGPGGTGKTTLAVVAAHAVQHRFEAAAFVALASVTDPDDVAIAIAEALDVKEAERRTALDATAERIGPSELLLVLDNLEQVVDAGSELAVLLDRCPGLRLLTTSRGPLKISDEVVHDLSPLDVAGNDARVATSHAMELLVTAAQKSDHDFTVTDDNRPALVSICRRLDGLPLALELAAGRLRFLSPEAVADRLDDALSVLGGGRRDADERHRGLAATIRWSHDLLDGSQQRLFASLSVFPGSASIEAVEAVAGRDVLDDLSVLVDVALVRAVHGRFSMLETIRQFAAAALAGAGLEADTRARHAAYVAAQAETIEKGIEGGDQLAAIERGIELDADFAEVLERCATADGDLELGLGLAGALWMYWHFRGKHLTTMRFTRLLLDRQDSEPTVGRCRALLALGLAEWSVGRIDDAGRTWRQSLELAERLDLPATGARAAFCVGVSDLGTDPASAVRWTSRGREMAEALGDRWAAAFALGFEALATALVGDLDAAADGFRRALAVQEAIGDHEGAGFSLGGLAFLAAASGDDAAAVGLYERSIAEYVIIDDRAEVARVLGELAWVLLRLADHASAGTRFLEAARAYRDVSSVRGMGASLIGLAAQAAAVGDHERATVIAAAAEVLSEGEGIVNVYADSPGGADLISGARDAFGSGVAAADARGRAMDADEVLAFASRTTG